MNNAMFYAWMSQASYLYFDNAETSLNENDGNLTQFLQNDGWKPKEDGEQNPRIEKYFAEKQAEIFTKNYSFVHHQENTEEGMSSTVFQSKADGSYTFAMRGTEPDAQKKWDILAEDIAEDGAGIFLSGKAKTQLVDAFHYYKRLTTAEGEKVTYTEAEDKMMMKLLTDNVWSVPLYSAGAAKDYIDNTLSQDTGLGEIEKGATINFTGHSLGGHLAYSLAEMVYASCEGQYEIGDIMTYNAPGEWGISQLLDVDTGLQEQFIANKHIAFYAEQGVDITAGLWKVVGTEQPVFIESNPSLIGQFSMDNHSIAKLSDTLSVYNIFAQLDEDFYSDISANNINTALPVLNDIMEKSSNDYNQSLETVLDKLDKLLDPDNADKTEINDKEEFYQKVQRLTEKSFEVKKNYDTHIEVLGKNNDFEKNALQDDLDDGIAYRYALKELNYFALTGYDYSKFNKNGELDLYSPDNKNGMTEEYIKDRFVMLKALSAGSEQIYDDMTTGIHLEISEDLVNGEYYSDHPEYTQRKIVFGTDGNDPEIKGGAYMDKLYGGAGDDVLIAGEATTYTDSGDGYDIPETHDDGVEDYLEGGVGFDTYHVGNKDKIFDSDVEGVIHFNGNELPKQFHALIKHNPDSQEKDLFWYELDKDGNKTGISAKKDGDHLRIFDKDGSYITIQNFFQVAHELDNGGFRGLSIELLPKEEEQDTQPENPDYLLWRGDIRPETDDNGKYKVNWLDHSARNENGEIINGSHQENFNDTIAGEAGKSNQIYGLTGNDALHGRDKNDFIDGGVGDDLIFGGGGKDTVYGGSGNDYIYSNLSMGMALRNKDDDEWKPIDNRYTDTIIQGSTWGVYHIENEIIVDSGANGIARHTDDGEQGDMLYGGSGNDNVTGGNNNDIIYGDELDNASTQTQKDGDDTLYGMGGDDLLYGNGGDDHIYGDSHNSNKQNYLHYLPTEQHGNDTIYAGNGKDWAYGNGGDDVIFGEDGDDNLRGDFDNEPESKQFAEFNGDDFIDGGNGNDQIVGGGGDDDLIGGSGDDLIAGDYWDEELKDISGNDYIDGGNGNDQILGGGGDDYIVGGAGDDLISGDYESKKIPQLTTVLGNDTIDGGDGDDEISGGGGDDHILGGQGDDHIFGDFSADNPQAMQISGNDTIDGQDGNDDIFGGGGDDTIYGGDGDDILTGDLDEEEFPQIKGNDYIDGGNGNDTIWADGGDDYAVGGKGEDHIHGGSGDDILDGGDDNDELHGDDGDDTLIAGKGNDKLAGGKGNDTYLFNKEDLQNEDVQYNVIWDEDGKGAIVIDGVYLHQQEWKATAENRWETDNMRLEKVEIDARTFLVWQSKETNALIGVEDYQDGDLGFELLPYNPETDDNGDDNGNNDDDNNNDDNPQPIHTNHAPVVNETLDEQTLKVNQEWSFRLPENLFTDPDGDKLTYTINNLPKWLQFNAENNTLTGTPTMDEVGEVQLQITATDEHGETATQTLDLNISNQGIDGATYVSGNKIGSLKADFMIGNDNDNTIRGNAGDDEIYGMDGNDHLYGGIGNDTLAGGKGDDNLYGGVGNDALIGGKGNDYLEGGLGNDTYHFKQGDGQDTIYDLGGGNDTLKISGVTAENLWFETSGKSVQIFMIGEDDNILIKNQNLKFLGKPNAIENIQLDDGSVLNAEQLNQLIADIADLSDEKITTAEQMQKINQHIDLSKYWTKPQTDKQIKSDTPNAENKALSDEVATKASLNNEQNNTHSNNSSDDDGSWYKPLNLINKFAQWLGLSHKDSDTKNTQNIEKIAQPTETTETEIADNQSDENSSTSAQEMVEENLEPLHDDPLFVEISPDEWDNRRDDDDISEHWFSIF